MKKSEIDWPRVRRAMLASFTGRGNPDQDYCIAAHAADPARYGRENRKVRKDERERIRRTGLL